MNARECETGEQLRFELLNLPNNDNLIIYASKGGEDCSAREVRERDISVDGDRPCIKLGPARPYSASDTITSMTLQVDEELCAEGLETAVTIFFLPSDSDVAPETQPGNYGCYDLQIDAELPNAPTNLNEPTGERTLKVEWEPVNDESVERYIAFYDTNPVLRDGGSPEQPDDGAPDDEDGGVDGKGSTNGGATTGATNRGCPSEFLREGAILDLDDLPDGIGSVSTEGRVASSVEISASLLGDDVAAAAVAAADFAGNVGPLSEVTCLRIEDTVGLWDLYQERGGQATSGCACTTLSKGDVGGMMPTALVLLGLWTHARRKRQ